MGLETPWGLPIAGMLIGAIIGFVARHKHFCTLSALERHWYANDSSILRAWALVAATTLATTQGLAAAGVIDLSRSIYEIPALPIAGSVVGGLMFGLGMALVGTCGFGALLRAGGGSMRAIVVLTGMALAAIAARNGITAYVRAGAIDPLSIEIGGPQSQSLGAIVSWLVGADVSLLVGLVVAAGLAAWALKARAFRADRTLMGAAVVIGLCVSAGWIVTSTFARAAMTPVPIEAASFVAPLGDAMIDMLFFTGTWPGYGVGLAFGVFLGAFGAAWRTKDLRWEACDDARELGRHLLGAFLMGTGGIFAMGCTIGQGISALSTLALSAPIVIAAIALGARIGLGILVEDAPFGFLRRHRPASRHGSTAAE